MVEKLWSEQSIPLKFVQGICLKNGGRECTDFYTQHIVLTWYTDLPIIIKLSQRVYQLCSEQSFPLNSNKEDSSKMEQGRDVLHATHRHNLEYIYSKYN